MTFSRTVMYPLVAAALTLIAACASNPSRSLVPMAAPTVVGGGTVSMPIINQTVSSVPAFSFTPRAGESMAKTLADYHQLDSVLKMTKAGDDGAPTQFLMQQSRSAMGESVRNEWLKSLGARGQIELFKQQYGLLEAKGRSQEVRCYAQVFNLDNDVAFVSQLIQETGRLPNGCNSLLQNRAMQGVLSKNLVLRRVRGLIANNQITDARNLASAIGGSNDEALLADIIGVNAQKSDAAAVKLQAIAGSLSPEQVGFAWGILGLVQARNQNMSVALSYFRQADRSQLNKEQFEWYARAALRLQNWQELGSIIQAMPADLRQDPAWLYWLGRSYIAQGKVAQAQTIWAQAATTGRNFYALLATEELGGRVNVQNNVADAPANSVNTIAQDGAIERALNLFQNAQQSSDWNMRRQAQAEWRYAIRDMNEPEMLAAAQLAYQRQFYEMAVNTADHTNKLLNYRLRYITPFRDLVSEYAAQVGIDSAWVYGLIRQESRFVMGAQSGVGAQGLMQVMPATAQLIAKKIGMPSSELYTMNGNIRMGTWYMADTRNNLQNSEVLATAGYNAGPGRARKWQATNALEGAIYAETIPFNETRDYVKKVMTNTVYYAALLNQPQTSLKQRMGIVPARY